MTASSRDRLLSAARDLFAERGFSATSVGDIEEAAGFARRGGNFYRHFESKEAALDEVVDEHVRAVRETKRLLELFPLGDRKAELRLVGRAVLQESMIPRVTQSKRHPPSNGTSHSCRSATRAATTAGRL